MDLINGYLTDFRSWRRCPRSRRCAIIDYRIIAASCGRGLVHLGNRGFCLFLGICIGIFRVKIVENIYFAQYVNI